MGLSLEQSPFLHAVSDNAPQRIQSCVTKLLKDFEQSSGSGPRYLNQLEEIVRFASGGSATGTHESSPHIATLSETNAFSTRRGIVDRGSTNLLREATPNQPSEPRIVQSRNFHPSEYQRNQTRSPHGRRYARPIVQKAKTRFTRDVVPTPRFTRR